MLNDLAAPLRLFMAVAGFAIGLIIGGVRADTHQPAWLFAGIILGGCAPMALLWVLARADRRLRAALSVGSAEIVRRGVEPLPTPGRVLRQRVAPHADGFLLSTPDGHPGGADLVVVTALVNGPVRRVACAVPTKTTVLRPGAPVRVALHPDRDEIAVLDDLVTGPELEAVANDPRWESERLPTDRSVVGGWAALTVAAAAGLVVGLLLVALVG